MNRRLLRASITGLSATLVTLLVLVALIVATPVGARLLVWVVDSSVPSVSLQYRSGTLNGAIALAEIDVRLPGTEVGIKKATFDWQPTCLLRKQICINQLKTEGLSVVVNTAEQSAQQAPLEPDTASLQQSLPSEADEADEADRADNAAFSLPVTLVIDDLELLDNQIQLDDIQFKAGSLALKAEAKTDQVIVYRLYLDQWAATLPAAQQEEEQEPTPWPLADLPEITLPIGIEIADVRLTNGQLTLDQQAHRFEQILLAASGQQQKVEVTELDIKHQWLHLMAKAKAELTANYPLTAELQIDDVALEGIPELDGQTLTLSAAGQLDDLNLASNADGPIELQLRAWANVVDQQLPFELSSTSPQLRWPMTESPDYRINQLQLEAKGNIEQQRVKLDGDIQALTSEIAKLALEIEHNPGEVMIDSAGITGQMGKADLSGSLLYGQRQQWDIALLTENLDLTSLLPDLGLKLSGPLKSEGWFEGEQWQVAINDAALNGELWSYPLELVGALSANSSFQGEAEQLRLLLNGTSLVLNGENKQQGWQLTGEFAAPQLGLWDPNLYGVAYGRLTLLGDADNPELTLDLTAKDIAYNALQTTQVDLELDYQALNNHQFNAQLTSAAIKQGDIALGDLSVKTDGDLNQQNLSLELLGELVSRFALSGNWDPDNQLWQGALESGSISDDDRTWKLDRPVQIDADVANGNATLAQHCWGGENGQLCLDEKAELGKSGNVKLSLNTSVDMALNTTLPESLTIAAAIDGSAVANWQPDTPPVINAEIQSKNGLVQMGRGDLPGTKVEWQAFEQRLSMTPERVDISTQILFDSEQVVSLDMDVEPKAPYRIDGQLITKQWDLAPYVALIPQLAAIEAKLNGDLALSGDLSTPQVNGQLALEKGRIEAVANPTKIEDLNVNLALKGDNAELDATALVGDGLTQIDGVLSWQRDVEGRLDIKGEKLTLLAPPMVMLEASPDLKIEIEPEKLAISGDVVISAGEITVKALPEGAVGVSNDVVFIDAEAEQTTANASQTQMDINVIIENNVNVDAMGATGVLGGELKLKQTPPKPISAYGVVNIDKGKFAAFGQKLDIRRGNVRFNGPLTQPNLDVEAVRTIKKDDVTAGIQVTGTPALPKLTLFSSPQMEQQEILSYITRGRGLSSSDGGGSMFATAALGLGVNRSGAVVSGVGESLGFTDFTLDTEGSGDDTQVTLSGYLGENLFLKYGVGVYGESGNEMTVRYFLQPELWIEAISAASEELRQSLDLYYSFDIE